jgi:dihydrofolate synthase/folylpolyglutamate synthase
VDYRERIRLNGKEIEAEELLRTYDKWGTILQENEASFFEITTAMAFAYFLEQKVNCAIFEVGLGGRLDGTQPFAAEVSVITSISYDHVKSLGNTLEKIAGEKAGIIKRGQKVVIGEIPASALAVIQQVATDRGADVLVSGRDFYVENIRISEEGTIFDYIGIDVTYLDLKVNLLGIHQAYNAALAITAYRLWLQASHQTPDEKILREALNKVNWQGRMQILHTKPTVIIDGAHNAEGVEKLVINLKEIFKGKRILTVLAILRDKNLDEMIRLISQVSDRLFISKNKSKRAAEIADQVAIAEKYGAYYETSYDVITALKRALAEAGEEDIIVIAGSLYTITEVLAERIFKEQK